MLGASAKEPETYQAVMSDNKEAAIMGEPRRTSRRTWKKRIVVWLLLLLGYGSIIPLILWASGAFTGWEKPMSGWRPQLVALAAWYGVCGLCLECIRRIERSR